MGTGDLRTQSVVNNNDARHTRVCIPEVEKIAMSQDNSLTAILTVIGTALTSGVSILGAAYFKARKELTNLKGAESKLVRDITQDETDSSSLKLLLESAGQWKKQYEASVARETRYRRLLSISDAKMRRFAEQAARDRDEDRRKIESLTRRIEVLEKENQTLLAQVSGRHQGSIK
jgi:hypothetical protein